MPVEKVIFPKNNHFPIVICNFFDSKMGFQCALEGCQRKVSSVAEIESNLLNRTNLQRPLLKFCPVAGACNIKAAM